ncbi:hypothetical protein [Lysinibacillus fusiformis]|uniref:hypothetical protein n=1 Tax=Lysinibacillus fusiformis TaxID=28031 RepID=UPI003D02D016
MKILRINNEHVAVVNFDHAIIYFEVEYCYCDSNLGWMNIKLKKCFNELFDFVKNDGIDIEFIKNYSKEVV